MRHIFITGVIATSMVAPLVADRGMLRAQRLVDPTCCHRSALHKATADSLMHRSIALAADSLSAKQHVLIGAVAGGLIGGISTAVYLRGSSASLPLVVTALGTCYGAAVGTLIGLTVYLIRR